MKPWAACIPAVESHALGDLRLVHGTESAETGDMVWLRGPALDEALEEVLKKVPGLERFEVLASNQLRSPGKRIPHRSLPQLDWRPLRDALAVSLPAAALGAELKQKLPVTLTRSAAEETPTAVLTAFAEWSAFALGAPAVRLGNLSFAVAENCETLVIGRPLPSVPGVRFVNRSGILTPCGFEWTPAVDAAVLRELFNLAEADVAVLHPDGTHQVIRAEQFVGASRSAVRLTASENGT